jgi:hypothetical protein
MSLRKFIDIVEGTGYIAKNSKEANDPRFSTGLSKDVRPGEIDRQAEKFGNEYPPPIINSKAAKNSTPNKLQNLGLNEDSINKLKTAVIKQVQSSEDEVLLDKVYTVLNQTNLQDRIQTVIANETDTKKYAKVIADFVINTPGTYKEKYDFIKGYPDGYIDVAKLISGKLVTFNELVTGNDFTKRVFDKLFAFTPESAGPGEFALAALSPRIKMKSKGDLYIDNKYIEVKTSAGKEVSSAGGRLGESGILNPVGVKQIIEKYINKKLGNVDIYIQHLPALLSSHIEDQKTIKAAATEIVETIFGHKDTNLINAIVRDTDVQQAYLAANWKVYQDDAGWEALLIVNRMGQVARLFKSPEQMAGALYSLNALIVSKDHAKAARQILSQVTLRANTVPNAANKAAAKVTKAGDATAPRTKRSAPDVTAAHPKGKVATPTVGDVGRTKRK